MQYVGYVRTEEASHHSSRGESPRTPERSEMEPIYLTAASMCNDEVVREEWRAALHHGEIDIVRLSDLFGDADGPATVGELVNIIDRGDPERELSVWIDGRTATIVATGGGDADYWTLPAVKVWLDVVADREMLAAAWAKGEFEIAATPDGDDDGFYDLILRWDDVVIPREVYMNFAAAVRAGEVSR